MDPVACLARIRALSAEIIRTAEGAPEMRSTRAARTAESKAVELAELCQALDGWMLSGGFSPWGPPAG